MLSNWNFSKRCNDNSYNSYLELGNVIDASVQISGKNTIVEIRVGFVTLLPKHDPLIKMSQSEVDMYFKSCRKQYNKTYNY